jgi:predicted HicB family RNase H-like nuclease
MTDVIKYKKFIGSVRFSAEDEIFFGKIEGINDLVTFEGNSVKELKKSFSEAVDDYLELCEKKNKSFEKSYKGSFNIRLPQELHKIAAMKAKTEGISLNQLIKRAVEMEIAKTNL